MIEALTGLAIHSCNFLAASLQSFVLDKSPEEAQHPNIAVNSNAQACTWAALFGLTFSYKRKPKREWRTSEEWYIDLLLLYALLIDWELNGVKTKRTEGNLELKYFAYIEKN